MKAYFDLPWIVTVILAIFFAWPLGIIHRLLKGKLLMAVLNIFLGWIFWWVDLISILLYKDIKWLI